MGELPPSALTMRPLDGVHRGMCLQLHGGAVDAIAFAESSSLSSASPDSMRSLSSLSGGGTDSPLDVEMPEGTVDRKVATGEDDSGIQSPDYRAENDHDNSVSVYLDADEEGWCEIRDDQDNVTLVLAPKPGHGDRNHGDHGRRSSGDSSATEAGLCCSGYEEDDDDDDDEEDSFLSLSSADVVMRCPNEEGPIQSSSRVPVSELRREDLQKSAEQGQRQSSSRSSGVGLVSELHQRALHETMEIDTEECQVSSSTRGPDIDHVTEPSRDVPEESMEIHSEECRRDSPTRMGHVSELHQDASQESMELHTREGQMQSSSRRPDVDPVNELQEEALQESMQLRVEESQMQSSSRRPDVGPVNELQEEALQESMQLRVEESQMQSSSRRPDVGPLNELQEEALQESMQLRVEESQMQSSSRRPDVGPVNELQEEALQDSMQLRVEESQMQSSSRRPDVGPVNELQEEALQESMQLRVEESQMQSSSRRPDVGPVNELQEEALQESMQLHVEESQMQSSSRRPDVGPVNELQEEALQESMQLRVEESQMQSSYRRPNVGPVNELQEEALQESMQLRAEESQMQSSSRRPDVGPVNELQEEALQESMQLRVEESQMQSSSRRPNVGPVNELHQEVPQDFDGPHIEKTLEATLSEAVLPPVSEDSLVEPSAPTQDAIETNASTTTTLTVPSTNNKAKHTKDPPGQGHARPTTKPSMTKSSKMELRRFPRPDLKNVKPKVVSRAASAPRPANPSQSAAGPEKKPPPTRGRSANIKDQEGDGAIKKRRSSSNQARVTMPAPAGDPRSKATHLQPEEKPPCVQPEEKPPCVNGANVSPEMTVRGDQEQKRGAEVMDAVKEEAEGHEEEVPVDAEEEAPKDVDQTGSKLKTPRAAGGAASVAAGGRAAVPAGVSTACSPSSSCKAPQKPTFSRLPVKNGGLAASLSSSSLGSAVSESNTPAISRGVAQVVRSEEKAVRPSSSSQGKPANNKPSLGIRHRANSTPVKPVTAGQKAPAQANNVAAKPTQNALQRSGSARPNRPPGTTVEKSSRGVRSVPGRPHSGAGGGGGGGGGGGVVTQAEDEEEKQLRLQNERKSQCILQLRKLVAHGNRRLEALALVIQHIFTEKEEALKQKKEVSLQLRSLREELTHSVSCCERLQKEKEEVCVALEAAVLKLQEQHQAELTQLEETLRDFYSAEWDKTHQAYQQEADKYRALMQKQVEEMRRKQEALRKEQEVARVQEMEALRQEYEASLAELRKAHESNMQELDSTRKQSEASLNERIESLMEENQALSSRLREEEERRKALSDKSQKDPHMVYLEQELESLKVVLEIKTSQLHQQDKKLMQMDKLMESNVKLEECLKKQQQENEDYKARMDKHAALSRQLSTEQAMLQQTLQLESKVNKRLSMENEELLWKLHNGDLNSPRRLSPSSPFHSPRNSASFPSAPVSPR